MLRVFWWEAATGTWLVDAPALPASLRPPITLTRGSALFLVVDAQSAIVVPLEGVETGTAVAGS